MSKVRLSAVLLFLLIILPANAAIAQPPVIPMPQSADWHDGQFPITAKTIIQGDGKATPTAAFLSQALGLKTGKGGASRIRLALVSDKVVAGEEAYRLTVTPTEIRIEASHSAGLFYGAQTLLQLVTPGPDGARNIPTVNISDAPRFRWRGLLIDVSRHFFGKRTMLQTIDEMARYKLNVLKLHLTDYEGWRLDWYARRYHGATANRATARHNATKGRTSRGSRDRYHNVSQSCRNSTENCGKKRKCNALNGSEPVQCVRHNVATRQRCGTDVK